MALLVDWPNVAVVPVSDPYSPTKISSPPPRLQAIGIETAAAIRRPARSTSDFILGSLLVESPGANSPEHRRDLAQGPGERACQQHGRLVLRPHHGGVARGGRPVLLRLGVEVADRGSLEAADDLEGGPFEL